MTILGTTPTQIEARTARRRGRLKRGQRTAPPPIVRSATLVAEVIDPQPTEPTWPPPEDCRMDPEWHGQHGLSFFQDGIIPPTGLPFVMP